MTIVIISTIVGVLSNIKLNKIADKEAKAILVKDFIKLKAIVRKAEESRQEIINKFTVDWAEEIPVIDELRKNHGSLEEHKEFLEAEKDVFKLINDIFSENVEVEITPIDLDKFVSAVDDESLTLETIAFLQENGVIV